MTRSELLIEFERIVEMPLGSIDDDWTALQFPNSGSPQAIAIVAGSEIHFAVPKEHRKRVIQRDRTRKFLAPLFDRYGYLTTSVMHGNFAAEEFIKRLGFVETWADRMCTHFMMTRLPFENDKASQNPSNLLGQRPSA